MGKDSFIVLFRKGTEISFFLFVLRNYENV